MEPGQEPETLTREELFSAVVQMSLGMASRPDGILNITLEMAIRKKLVKLLNIINVFFKEKIFPER